MIIRAIAWYLSVGRFVARMAFVVLVLVGRAGTMSTGSGSVAQIYPIPLEQAVHIAGTAMSSEFGGAIKRVEAPNPEVARGHSIPARLFSSS